LANTSQARKRARQAEVRRKHNQHFRSMLRTLIKKVVYAVQAGDKEKAQNAYSEAVPILDRTVNRGLIHRNKAARHKSRLNALLKAM